MEQESPIYQLVVVGASAGGIDALSTLVATLPSTFPAPVVIAQHLDPARPSHLAEILSRRSAIPVRAVVDHAPLENGVVFVVPANRHVEITDHTISLRTTDGGRAKPSVDLLLTSAAHVFGENLIAVVLTGMGTDGAVGARAVKEAGGMVVIQNPQTAQFAGMPAAIAPTLVDVVADLDAIGPLLHDLLTDAYTPAQPAENRTLRALLEQLHDASGIDFSHYRAPTIQRRVQRRMAATGMRQLADYVRYVQSHPEEYERLVSTFLVKVTEFFRDPELFAYLRQHVLPELVAAARGRDNELRLWSAGTATGEEAYSLAILLAEVLGDELERFTVRVFATDLDTAAVAFARRGYYPAAALATLPPELVQRYFTALDGSYEINKSVRSLVIFGEHDLGQRAPFPRIDLCLCRNVLIYFTPELKQRALQLFAFALRDGGYLVLGKAETPGPLSEFFVPAHPNLKLYRRQGDRMLIPSARIKDTTPPRLVPGLTTSRTRGRPVATHAMPEIQRPRASLAEDATLLRALPWGVVVVDRHYDIQSINSAARRMLNIHGPAMGEDLLHLIERLAVPGLRAAIDAVLRDGTQQELLVAVETPRAERRYLQLICRPRPRASESAEDETTLSLPADRGATPLPQRKGGGTPPVESGGTSLPPAESGGTSPSLDPREGRQPPVVLDGVLILVQDVTAIEGARRAQEDAQTREVQALRESHAREIAAQRQDNARAQEEIDHLRTRLQRVEESNRELEIANEQLNAANAGLHSTNEESLLGTEETQAAMEEVETLNEELQATNEELETLNEELQATVEELNTTNDDLQARNLEMHALAAEREEQRQRSEAQRAQLAAVLLSIGEAVLVVDRTGAVVLTNAAVERLFGPAGPDVVPEDEQGQPLPAEVTPRARAARGETFNMTFTLSTPTSGESGATPPRPDGARRWFEATGQPIQSAEGGNGGVVVIRDISERSLRRLQEEFLAVASHELRTPLTPIRGYLELLGTLLGAPGTDERAQRYLAQVREQVQRLQRLIDDLLDVGRLHEGKLHLDREPVDLVPLVRELVEAIQASTPQPPLHLESVEGPLPVLGDATRLGQIVVNLLANAEKYASDGDRIDVRLWREDRQAVLEVQDYGQGIATTALPHLFERFYQAERDGATGGLGVGLYITRELVQAHGGEIAVHSVEGDGATFTVYLPISGQ